MTDVFISYSRKDKEFVKSLHNALLQSDRNTWVDWEDIPLAADWWQEIERGIEAADTFVFVLSPDAIASKVCAQEINHAVENHKRLVPIVWRDDFEMQQVHPSLQKHNWLFARTTDDFDRAFQDLLHVIDTDLEYVRSHTRLLMRSIEWEQHHRDASFLLRGNDLKAADRWLNQGVTTDPTPTPLQTQYILASGKAEIQRQRQGRMIATGGLVGAIGLAAIAFIQYQQANQRQIEAENGQIMALSASANAYLASNQEIEALITAIQVGQKLSRIKQADATTQTQAVSALQQVIYTVRERNRLEGHTDYVRQASFSPDGKTIATASDDRTVKLWRQDGTLLKTFKENRGYVWGVVFSPDGQTIATAGADATIKLWNREGKLLRTLKGHRETVTSIAFSPDGQILASASADRTVKLWKRDGTLLQTLTGHHAQISQVSFSPNGQRLATASQDRTVKLWKSDGTLLTTFKGHRGEVWTVGFSPDGQTLASGSEDQTIKLWKLDGTLIKTLKGHNKGVLAVGFSPNGQALASGSDDKTMKLWKADGTLLQTLRGHNDSIINVSFSPNSQTLISTSLDGTAKVWQVHTPLLSTLKIGQGVDKAVFSPGGSQLLVFGSDRTLSLWNLDGTKFKTLPIRADFHDFSASRTGGLLALAGTDNRVTIWRNDGTLVKIFPAATVTINYVEFSTDGQTLATLSNEDKTLRLWNLEGKLLQTFSGPVDWANWVRISPDLQQVLTVGSSGAKLWRRDGTFITTLAGQGEITYVRFSDDSQTIATSSFDKTVKLWTREGKLITTLKGHTASVNRVNFSPDQQMLVTTGTDNTVRLWKRDGTLLTTLKTDSPSPGAGFSPDGKMIIFIADSTIYLWDISNLTNATALMAQGCTLLQDYLISHPKRLLELETCQTKATLLPAGEALAMAEDVPNAVKLFRQALQQDPSLKFDPQAKAELLATQGKAQRLVTEGQDLALEGKIPEAIAQFQTALTLNPALLLTPTVEAQRFANLTKTMQLLDRSYTLAKGGYVKEAMEKLRAATAINPDLSELKTYVPIWQASGLLDQITRLVRNGKIPAAIALANRMESLMSISEAETFFPGQMNALCAGGSVANQAAIVMPVCEKVVAAYPNNGEYRDRRGIARALMGNVAGAISDFQAFVEWTEEDDRKAQRQAWIKALQAGQNPLTPKVLQTLREKEL